MSRKIVVETLVDIPPFVSVGRVYPDGRVFIDVEDVCAYLTTVAAAFDHQGSIGDIGHSIRAIRDGLTEPRVGDVVA